MPTFPLVTPGQAEDVVLAFPLVAGSPVGSANPMPVVPVSGAVQSVRSPMAVTITLVTLPAGVSTRLIAANPSRKFFWALNVGTGFATVMSYPATGTYTVTAGQGYPLEAASAAGHQGGGLPTFDGSGVSTDEWDAICATSGGTTILVMEGN